MNAAMTKAVADLLQATAALLMALPAALESAPIEGPSEHPAVAPDDTPFMPPPAPLDRPPLPSAPPPKFAFVNEAGEPTTLSPRKAKAESTKDLILGAWRMGKSYTAIAKLAGTTQNTVKTAIARARKEGDPRAVYRQPPPYAQLVGRKTVSATPPSKVDRTLGKHASDPEAEAAAARPDLDDGKSEEESAAPVQVRNEPERPGAASVKALPLEVRRLPGDVVLAVVGDAVIGPRGVARGLEPGEEDLFKRLARGDLFGAQTLVRDARCRGVADLEDLFLAWKPRLREIGVEVIHTCGIGWKLNRIEG